MGPTIPVLQMVFFSSDRERSLPDLDYIINVDFPPNLQTYMDRLRKGVVHYTLFCREDSKHAERLIYTYNQLFHKKYEDFFSSQFVIRFKQARQEYDPSLSTMAKAWLECGRDMRFMPLSTILFLCKIFNLQKS